MLTKTQFLLIILIISPVNSLFVIDILRVSQVIVSGMYKLWEEIEPKLEGPNAPTYPTDRDKTFLKKISVINSKLADIQEKLINVEENTLKRIATQSERLLMHLKITPLFEDIDSINRMDRIFKRYLQHGLKRTVFDEKVATYYEIDRHTLENFALTITSHFDRSILMISEKLHDFIMGNIHNNHFSKPIGLFEMINKYAKEAEGQFCDISQSTNQLIFNMYTLLQMSQLKAYTMIQFSWLLLKVYNKGNFSMETNLMRRNYLDRISQQALAVKKALETADNVLWKCDPKMHVEGETYTEITRFLQGFIVNEVDMNTDGTCRENCAFYKYGRQTNCFQNLFCAKQAPCRGNIVGCTFVDSDMWVCQAPRWSKRRYDWIEYENGRVLGEKSTCSRGVSKVDSWWRWLFWHCSYCFCFCDDPKDLSSNRYFNLREVTSDVENNKIVTGLRFIKASGVIHIQIQEGELLEHGEVDASSVAWRPIDDYSIESSGVTAGVDYHMLTWEHRAIDLDNLMLPKDHVVTGIKFRKIGGHLNLEIRGSELNVTSGKLKNNGKKSIWISNDNTDGAHYKPREQLLLYKPDLPTKRYVRNEPDSKSDQFIEFTSTDVDADVGQSAVPFIDIQLVAPQPPIPLIGVGIYHKGTQRSGGFIAPKVYTYDYMEQISNFFPEINEAE